VTPSADVLTPAPLAPTLRTPRFRFALKIQETDPTELKPVFIDGGINYVYIQVSDDAERHREKEKAVVDLCGPPRACCRRQPLLTVAATSPPVLLLAHLLQHNNIFIVALTRKNSNVTAILVFLERLVEVRAAAGEHERAGAPTRAGA
jgi:hypothetical protein